MNRLGVVALAMAWSLSVQAAAEEAVPPELAGIGIDDQAGAQVPVDVALTDSAGQKVTVGEYLKDGKPLVLVLAYYRCPMLCSLVISGLTNGLKDLEWTAGREYRVLVVSFDPRDTVQIARDKRTNYLKEYGRPIPDRGYEFLVGDEANVKRLADAVGFRYRWDATSLQYAHAAGAFVLTPQGKVSRTLWGISFPGKDLRLALTEASEGKLGSAWDKVMLFCYHYDPSARGYVLAATRLMRAGGALTVLLLGLFLWRVLRSERHPLPAPGDKAA
jgi:protein SCO1/2